MVTNPMLKANSSVFRQGVQPFIDGKFIDSTDDATVDVVNPSRGRVCTTIPAGSELDVDRAVLAAQRAFADGRWSDAPPSFRKKVLHAFADRIAADAQLLDALDAEEMGKPVGERFAGAAHAAGLVRFCAEALDKVMGDVLGSDVTTLVVQRRVPRGVVAAIVPWNFPTYVTALKIAPALAAGNCLVLKPSELSSRSAIHLANLALEAGLPAGVLNVVPGLGETVGRAMALHADVSMLTFTGSTEVGKLIMQAAGQSNLKAVLLECGGKSPHIVFADGVDLDAVSASIAKALLTNQGQICSVGSRLLVQSSVANKVIGAIASKVTNIVIGDALDPNTTFGPLASRQQCARVQRYIESARDTRATLVTGGRRVREETGGFFIEPTIFTDVPPDARIAQEEIFGPVLSVISFADEAEALRLANSTIYGLGAYVWTADLSTGMRMAKGLRTTVRVNAAAPVGEGAGFAYSSEPAGQSGFGPEGGMPGIESYMRRQLVWFNHS
jgi:acyl-CoA reductase-like NAD-dependent aldehyde dehydrogenase